MGELSDLFMAMTEVWDDMAQRIDSVKLEAARKDEQKQKVDERMVSAATKRCRPGNNEISIHVEEEEEGTSQRLLRKKRRIQETYSTMGAFDEHIKDTDELARVNLEQSSHCSFV